MSLIDPKVLGQNFGVPASTALVSPPIASN